MATELVFSWAVPEDLAALESFQAAAYGADSVQTIPGRTRWMYFAHPLGLHVALCRQDGRIVGACGHLPQIVDLDGRRIEAAFGVDFMVDDGHRRRGIGRRFLEMRLERFALSLSTGQSPGMLALYRSAGAVDMGSLGVATFRRRPSVDGPPRKSLRDAVLWLHGLASGGVRQDGLLAESPAAAIDAGDEPGDWLRWRYNGPVYGDYAAWRLGDASAYGRKAGEKRLVTRAVGPKRAELLATLARTGPARETSVLFAGDALRTDLRRAGYHLGATTARIMAVTLDPSLAARLRPGRLELTAEAADADLLRSPG
ncbi:MAG: GNAT family N-acetyltransferase [bacterium]|nr:GNAT family N-acetyltransferase [bacterium]